MEVSGTTKRDSFTVPEKPSFLEGMELRHTLFSSLMAPTAGNQRHDCDIDNDTDVAADHKEWATG